MDQNESPEGLDQLYKERDKLRKLLLQYGTETSQFPEVYELPPLDFSSRGEQQTDDSLRQSLSRQIENNRVLHEMLAGQMRVTEELGKQVDYLRRSRALRKDYAERTEYQRALKLSKIERTQEYDQIVFSVFAELISQVEKADKQFHDTFYNPPEVIPDEKNDDLPPPLKFKD